ncbi:MAG: hypothetical protein HY392_00460 [Candidatus Diapherotrites archaeon]|nr:hypothetical protein [Candidatus Diapherotrites archaeon]
MVLAAFSPNALAGAVDVNVWRFATNQTGGQGTDTNYNFADGFPFLSEYHDGNLQIDFNVSSPTAGQNILLDFNLTTHNKVGGGDRNYVIYVDLNLAATTLPGQVSRLCDTNNFTSQVMCRIDLNISRSVVTIDGNFFILMKVYDANNAGQKAASPNTDTNLSQKSLGIDNQAPNLTWDGNHATWQAFDANVILTCTDYNSTGGDANNSGCGPRRYRVDTDRSSTITMPAAFSTFDANVLIGPSGDGNYAFDWNVTDLAGNKAISASGLSGTTDYNRTYVQIDKSSAQSISITNSGGNGGSDRRNGTSFTLTYSPSSDGNGSGIDTYYITLDNNSNWINNGTSTSYPYSLDSSAKLPATITFGVLGNDGVDKNTALVTYAVTFEGGSGGPGGTSEVCGNGVCSINETTSNCPTDCKAVCGDKICTGNESRATCPQDCIEGCGNTVCEETESCFVCQSDCGVCEFTSTETITEKELDAQPTVEHIVDVLGNAGFSQNEIDNAIKIVGEIKVLRNIVEEKKVTSEGWNVFETTIQLSFFNNGDAELRNVKIVEQVPKDVAQTSSQIVSDSPYIVLEDDPVIQFELVSIQPNSMSTVSYSISGVTATNNEAFGLFGPPIVASLQSFTAGPAPVCTTDSDCDDRNICTVDRCVKEKCAFAQAENGYACGFDKECRNGICTQISGTTQPVAGKPFNNWVLVGVVILVIAALSIYALRKKWKK